MPMCCDTVVPLVSSLESRPNTPSPKPSAVDCSRSDRIRARVTIALFELFPRANRFHIDHSINGENTIQMVDFMLQKFGKIALVSRFKLEHFGIEILVAYRDLAVAFNLHEH